MPLAIPTPAEIRAFRTERLWSQAAFAERLGTKVRTIEDWEAGRRTPQPLLGLAFNFIIARENIERQLELMRSGTMRIRSNNVDVTEESCSTAEAQIRQYDMLIRHGGWGSDTVPGEVTTASTECAQDHCASRAG